MTSSYQFGLSPSGIVRQALRLNSTQLSGFTRVLLQGVQTFAIPTNSEAKHTHQHVGILSCSSLIALVPDQC